MGLLLLIIIPIIAGIFSGFLKSSASRYLAVAGSIAALVINLVLAVKFNPNGGMQFVWDKVWFSQAVHFTAGVDGISFAMLLLTNGLIPLIILSQWNKTEEYSGLFYGLIAIMQGALNGVFVAMDGMMFYIFWELALIPIYFICSLWGSGDKYRINLKLFIYTFLGSLFMLASLIYLYLKTGGTSFSFKALVEVQLNTVEKTWVGLGILLAFAIKIPLFPFHNWQPDAYTHAPAAGSMLLSGIMLKMGLYGLIRWYIPIAPESLATFSPIIIILALVGILYGGFIAIVQKDLKRLIAYSSLSHVGLIAAGIITLRQDALQGAVFQMVSHGVNVVGMFMVADVIEQRAKTRDITMLGGIAKQAHWFTIAFFIIVLGTMAVPFTNGFPGELLLLRGVFNYNTLVGVLAGLTIILCAVYMLRAFQHTMLGEAKGGIYLFADLKWNEALAFGALIVLIIWNGFAPQWLFDLTNSSVKNLLDILHKTMGGVA